MSTETQTAEELGKLELTPDAIASVLSNYTHMMMMMMMMGKETHRIYIRPSSIAAPAACFSRGVAHARSAFALLVRLHLSARVSHPTLCTFGVIRYGVRSLYCYALFACTDAQTHKKHTYFTVFGQQLFLLFFTTWFQLL